MTEPFGPDELIVVKLKPMNLSLVLEREEIWMIIMEKISIEI